MSKPVFQDIVCQVLVRQKSIAIIYAVLQEFLPGFTPLHADYVEKPNDPEYVFASEAEMISCYINSPDVRQTFYWNHAKSNPDRLMLGANLLEDECIVFSITLDGTEAKAAEYLDRLKAFLHSNVAVISYINPAEYSTGKDFEQRYDALKHTNLFPSRIT